MKKLRYAGYVRVSDPRQVDGYSLDAQKAAIERFVAQHDGLLVNIYVDGGISGTSTNRRDDFNQMRVDAKRGAFDVLVVQKFDRLARNRLDAATTKMMLRKDCNIKILSASGEPSADTDPITGALVEMIMEAMAEWYSINLGQEVKKGRLQMLDQKKWYGTAPYGYRRDAKLGILVPDQIEAPIVREIFEIYAAGGIGFLGIARMLNARGLRTRQYKKKGGREWTKATIQVILKSRVYIGELPYQPITKDSKNKRTYDNPREWYKGTHEPLISEKVFEQCQQNMRANDNGIKPPEVAERYLLREMCYCATCQLSSDTDDLAARMIAKTLKSPAGGRFPYYCCRQVPAHGGYARADHIEAELIDFLLSGRLVDDVDGAEKTVAAIATNMETAVVQRRIEEIAEIVARLDFRFDHGAFVGGPDEFLAERQKLEDEMAVLKFRVGESYEHVFSVLNDFAGHWEAAQSFDERRNLIRTVVERVIIADRHILAVVVRPSREVVFPRGAEDGRAGVGVWPLPVGFTL